MRSSVSTIVIGVDGPERSSDALALARRLAEAGTRLVPVTVAERRPARALQGVATELGASLIVVGSSRAGALRRALPGSTARQLLHGAPCPVAIAPHGFRERADDRFEVVACAYDGTPESRRALTCSIELSERLGAALRLLSVTAPPTAADAILAIEQTGAAATRRIQRNVARELHRVVAELDPALRAEGVIVCGDPADELVRASVAADLVVLGSRGYGPLRGSLLGSVSARVVTEARCPVIVVPRTLHPTPAAARTQGGVHHRATRRETLSSG